MENLKEKSRHITRLVKQEVEYMLLTRQVSFLKKSDLVVVFLDRLKFVCILYEYNSGWDSSE